MTDGEITRKLQAWSRGDGSAVEELLPFLVANMRVVARRMPKRGRTLNTTALVNEAWLRLAGANIEFSDREHFLAIVARAMRHILTDHARAQQALKRGGGIAPATLAEDVELTDSQIEQLLIIEDLLEHLESENPRRCHIFEMRFFAGFSVEELAQALSVSENTVIRDYRLACAWLRSHFGSQAVHTHDPA
jgi:RNA polymerase sigma factor (TIGR02999 family)